MVLAIPVFPLGKILLFHLQVSVLWLHCSTEKTKHSKASEEINPQRSYAKHQEGDKKQQKHLYLLVFSRKVN